MIEITTITRSFDFDYGHRILGHSGKCRHLHGHRGKALITVSTPQLDDLNMVLDFGVIKEKVGKWIDENLDHNLLLNSKDPQLLHFKETEEREPFVMPNGNPTAEAIAKVIYDQATRLLGYDFKVILVRVFETPNCMAEYKGI